VSQHCIGVTGLHELLSGATIVARDRLVAEPDDRLVGISRQLLGRSKDPDNGLQALLDKE
jgi:hypothetical protein